MRARTLIGSGVAGLLLVGGLATQGQFAAATTTQQITADSQSQTTKHPGHDKPAKRLNILITNDDGYAAPGINAVYNALKAAGHQVTMVAPLTNQSGVSARISFAGTLQVTHPVVGDENIWAVDNSPATATIFGVNQVFKVLKGQLPDLVISGSNVGANTGFDTNFSGTIGAATVASGFFGIPAIAVSTETPAAQSAYDQTAALVVKLLDRGLPKLPQGQFLNINYPALTDAVPSPKGIRYAATDPSSAAAFSYTQTDSTTWNIVPGRSTTPLVAGKDRQLLADGYVTVTVLDSDRSVSKRAVPGVQSLIKYLGKSLTG